MDVLIVGGGSIGERHLRCFQQAMDGEVALCENFEQRRQEVAERYQLRQSFATLEQAIQQHWDAAVICTPAHLHVPHALELFAVCNALMIEKPLATELEEARKLLNFRNRVVNIAYVNRVSPAVAEVKRRLEAGEIGKLLQVNVVSGQHFPTFRPAYREIYYRDRKTGGGAIQDAATHTFNLVHYLAGRFDWVFCDYAHQALEGVDVEDTIHLTGRCQHGQVMVNISLNQFMAPNETRCMFNGEKGTLQLQMPEHRWGIYRHGDSEWTWSPPLVTERDELFRLQAQAFLRACTAGEPVLCDIDDALHTLKVNLAALRSAGQRRIEIEPETQT